MSAEPEPPGVLTPAIIRKALDELWHPPGTPWAHRASDGIEQIPVLRYSPSSQAKISRDYWDREAWIQGIKERLGLVCIGDVPRERYTVSFDWPELPPEWHTRWPELRRTLLETDE